MLLIVIVHCYIFLSLLLLFVAVVTSVVVVCRWLVANVLPLVLVVVFLLLFQFSLWLFHPVNTDVFMANFLKSFCCCCCYCCPSCLLQLFLLLLFEITIEIFCYPFIVLKISLFSMSSSHELVWYSYETTYILCYILCI